MCPPRPWGPAPAESRLPDPGVLSPGSFEVLRLWASSSMNQASTIEGRPLIANHAPGPPRFAHRTLETDARPDVLGGILHRALSPRSSFRIWSNHRK